MLQLEEQAVRPITASAVEKETRSLEPCEVVSIQAAFQRRK